MATDNETFLARAELVIARVMHDGTIAAASREAVKDVRQTLNEVFFGRGEHGGEIGAPMNPLFSELAEAKEHWNEVMTASELARDNRPYQPEASHSQEHERGQGR